MTFLTILLIAAQSQMCGESEDVTRGGGMGEKGEGLIFIISAPSGAGKTTLLRKVMEELPGLRFSVSYTTRPPRANERDGGTIISFTSVFQKMVSGMNSWSGQKSWEPLWNGPKEYASSEIGRIDLILDIDTRGETSG
jgi:guanylate kinase